MSEAATAQTPASAASSSTLLWCALLVAALGAVFAATLGHGFVNWDDLIYVTQNQLVTEPNQAHVLERLTTPQLGYPVPLPVLIYGWLWSLGGGSALPFHAVNLALHLATTLLIFSLLRRAGLQAPGAALVALGFGVHPLVVEPVAWITGLKDLLLGLGVLLAWAWRDRPWRMLGASFLALAAKPVAVVLGPGLLFALWVDRRAAHKTDGQPEGVSADLSVAPRGLAWGVAAFITLVDLVFAAYVQGAESQVLRTTMPGGLDVGRMLAAAGLTVAHGLVPLGLAPRYAPEMVAPGMMAMGLVALAVALLHLRWWWRARDHRAGLVVLSLLLYLPVSNIRPLVRFTADSYAYTPWLLVVLVIGYTLSTAPQWSRRVRLVAAGLALVWGGASFVQVGVWRSSATLWGAAYEAQSGDGEAVYRYGDALGREGETRAEIALYLSELKALEGAPKIPVALMVYFERGGELQRAARWYGIALRKVVAQDEAVYWYYAEFVARFPALHDPALDDALAHALATYVRERGRGHLQAVEFANLVTQARRLGREDWAAELGG